MLFPEEENDRLYTIGEVAEELEVTRSLVRFWESEFPELAPAKNERGERRYTFQDRETLHYIYHLVKERGFTLAGAKKELALLRKRQQERSQMIARLTKLRAFLLELRPNDN
jgi:DNA-binding transcriptional MerR regulator